MEPEESNSIIKSYAELLQDSVEDIVDEFSTIDDACNTSFPAATQSSSAILAIPCGNGLRVDCLNKDTCTLRHIDEVPEEPLSKYVKKTHLKLKCQVCCKSFSNERGLNIHVSKVHPSAKHGPAKQIEKPNDP